MKSILYSASILLSLFFLPGESTNAQSWLWAKSMGGAGNEVCSSVSIDPVSGDVYTTGYFQGIVDFDPGSDTYFLSSLGEYNIFISKLDASGNFVWAKAMESVYLENYGYGYGYGLSISFDQAGSGSIYITGCFTGTMDFDPGPGILNYSAHLCYLEYYGYVPTAGVFICRFDELGNLVWAQAFASGDEWECLSWCGNSIVVDPSGSGNVFITGTLTYYGATFISKFDSLGNFAWTKWLFGIEGSISGISSAIDPGSGNVYTTGVLDGSGDFDPDENGVFEITAEGYWDVFVLKLDSLGNFIWAKTIGGDDYDTDVSYSIAVDSNSGNVYTTGYFMETADFDPGEGEFNLSSIAGSLDIFISKLDSLGNFVWAKQLGGTGEDHGLSIVVDGGSGDVYNTGFFEETVDFDPGSGIQNLTSAGQADIFISKLDSSGNYVYGTSVGGTFGDHGRSIALDANKNLQVVGSFNSPSISFDSTTLINIDVSSTMHRSDLFVSKLNPCTSIVTSISDSGIGSLRDRCSCSSSGETITFSLAPQSQITLTSGEIVINKNLTFSGPGILDLTISGNNASRIFHILPGKNLDIKNLSLKNATSLTNGGAIFSEGNLILENVLLQNNFQNGIPKAMTISPGVLVAIGGNVEIKN